MLRIFLFSLFVSALATTAVADVWELQVDGAIGPATADYVVRGLDAAEQQGAEAVILQMNTPGGLDLAMRDIVKRILAADVPVIGYVAPSGSRAASAGTYILYACHLAAMAPATNLGAATPVQIGGSGFSPPQPQSPSQGEEQEKPSVPDTTAMERKIVNDAVAYIQGLAELRGRNAEWAVAAVTDAETLTAEAALKANVINLVAENREELLAAAHGMEVKLHNTTHRLNTADAEVKVLKPDWRNQFLSIITDPNVAYMMLLIGIYGLIFEFSNPGMGAPGVIGAICLLIALYALQVLPVSYSALALIVLGIGLMAAEAFSPSFGVLGVGGIAAFIVGSIMLMDSDLPAFSIALPVILAVSLVSAMLLIVVLGMLLRMRRQQVVSGISVLVDQIATVIRSDNGFVLVHLQGENWQVHCTEALQVGDRVRVISIDGLTLNVEKQH